MLFKIVAAFRNLFKMSSFDATIQVKRAFITRDDVVSQHLKFGSAFLLYSWESKIALFF